MVGDLDPKPVLEQLTALLGDWKAEQPYRHIPNPVVPVPGLDKAIETPDKANAFLLGGFTFAMKDDDPDYPALLLADYVLGGGTLKSRLADRIRQKEGISYGVGSFLSVSPMEPAANWGVYAIYNPANAGKLQKALDEELASALKDGFHAEEVRDAKLSWRQAQEVNRSQDAGLAQQVAGQLHAGRTMAFAAELEKKVLALKEEQLLPVLRKYLDPSRLVLVKAGDFAKAAKDAAAK